MAHRLAAVMRPFALRVRVIALSTAMFTVATNSEFVLSGPSRGREVDRGVTGYLEAFVSAVDRVGLAATNPAVLACLYARTGNRTYAEGAVANLAAAASGIKPLWLKEDRVSVNPLVSTRSTHSLTRFFFRLECMARVQHQH